jgi:tetratricopeptide (TPR) repeat protein
MNPIIIGPLVLLAAVCLVTGTTHYVTHRRLDSDLRPHRDKSLTGLVRHWVVAGTDSDLKLELAYFAGLVSTGLLLGIDKSTHPGVLHWTFAALIALVLGYHARQWLSKWRLRNIVSLDILRAEHILYIKSLGNIGAFVLNLLFSAYLVHEDLKFAVLCFAGFFIQDVALESRKASRLLQRKLYIFDLEDMPVPEEKLDRLCAAIRKFNFRVLRRMIREAEPGRDQLLLTALDILLRDDFEGLKRLVIDKQEMIREDYALAFFFGKALFRVGDLDRARMFLTAGSQLGESDDDRHLCIAHLALVEVADSATSSAVSTALGALRDCVRIGGNSKGAMFMLAVNALVIALASRHDAEADLPRAVSLIHEALRINESLAARDYKLGELGDLYRKGNEQIFLDIYGYILYRMGTRTLAFRVLEQAIIQDNTYPWPYFHLALIYDAAGRNKLARDLLFRVAAQERSDSVLRRLCRRKLIDKNPEPAGDGSLSQTLDDNTSGTHDTHTTAE